MIYPILLVLLVFGCPAVRLEGPSKYGVAQSAAIPQGQARDMGWGEEVQFSGSHAYVPGLERMQWVRANTFGACKE